VMARSAGHKFAHRDAVIIAWLLRCSEEGKLLGCGVPELGLIHRGGVAERNRIGLECTDRRNVSGPMYRLEEVTDIR